jgi:hypothetical protein
VDRPLDPGDKPLVRDALTPLVEGEGQQHAEDDEEGFSAELGPMHFCF